MQHIIIKNNGPVKDFEMDVNQFNVLIGAQATGKSTIAKSIYLCRYLKTQISNILIQIMESGCYNGEKVGAAKDFRTCIYHGIKNVFINLFGYSWELDSRFEIEYTYTTGVWVRYRVHRRTGENDRQYISIEFSPKLTKSLNALYSEARSIHGNSVSAPLSLELNRETNSVYRKLILSRISEVFEDDQTTYYIPAGRSIITLLSASRATMNSLQNIDFVMDRFIELIDGVRNVYQNGVSEAFKFVPRGDRVFDVHDIAKQIIELQKGEYRSSVSSGESLTLPDGARDGEKVKINFASSGQQEILWLLNFLYVLMLRNEKAFVIIEEPEAHIYPSLQKKIIDFIIQFANISKGNILITTHSPYVLMTMNNAYYAGCVAAKGKESEVAKTIKPVYQIGKGKLTAIKLNASHEDISVDLQGEIENEISSHLIDEVSDEINERYTSLFMINEEFGEKW